MCARQRLQRLLLIAALAVLLNAPAAGAQNAAVGLLGQHVVAEGETLLSLARHYNLGFVELRAANPGIDAWQPGVGTRLILPTTHLLPEAPREGIVLNLAEQRLFYFPQGGTEVLTHPIGIGDSGWETPVGTTRVRAKRVDPTWVPPASIRAQNPGLPAAVPPGPDNPLGAFALDLAWPSYAIHGTNKPDGVGRRVSHGCIRLYPEDIARLFPLVPVGTSVTVVDQAVKIAWVDDALYLEVHPTQAQANEIEATGRFTPAPPANLEQRLRSLAGEAASDIDWPLARQVALERRGVPIRVSR